MIFIFCYVKKDFTMGVFTAILYDQFLKGRSLWLTVPEKKMLTFYRYFYGQKQTCFWGYLIVLWYQVFEGEWRTTPYIPENESKLQIIPKHISIWYVAHRVLFWAESYSIFHLSHYQCKLGQGHTLEHLAVFFSLHGTCWRYDLYQGFLWGF